MKNFLWSIGVLGLSIISICAPFAGLTFVLRDHFTIIALWFLASYTMPDFKK